MINKFFNWLLPNTCIICGFQNSSYFCIDCFDELPWLESACLTCAEPLFFKNQQCGECLIDPPEIDRIICLFHYKTTIRSLITKLKFQKKLFYAYPLGELLANNIQKIYLDANLTLPECIIPVPLFKKRLKTRGYNQALEITKSIKKSLNIPIDFACIKRIKLTAPQTLLPVQERANNVKNAFKAIKSVNFNHVAIIDDVVTTMSTLKELAGVLKKQGVGKVDAWCLAKATRL